jgi:Flp pilus assembly protein TadG
MVTAELAACLPVLALVLAVAVAAVSVVGQRVRAQDAAGEVARAAGRGDPSAAARLFTETAPANSAFTVSSVGGEVTAIVRTTMRPLGGWLGSYTIEERAVAAAEPGQSTAPVP